MLFSPIPLYLLPKYPNYPQNILELICLSPIFSQSLNPIRCPLICFLNLWLNPTLTVTVICKILKSFYWEETCYLTHYLCIISSNPHKGGLMQKWTYFTIREIEEQWSNGYCSKSWWKWTFQSFEAGIWSEILLHTVLSDLLSTLMCNNFH